MDALDFEGTWETVSGDYPRLVIFDDASHDRNATRLENTNDDGIPGAVGEIVLGIPVSSNDDVSDLEPRQISSKQRGCHTTVRTLSLHCPTNGQYREIIHRFTQNLDF
ncbi:hypothetical protein AB7C87_05600 [Natrarchaeobius sp. A-rgal3]